MKVKNIIKALQKLDPEESGYIAVDSKDNENIEFKQIQSISEVSLFSEEETEVSCVLIN